MNNKVILACLLLLGITVGLFFYFFERYEEEIDRGWSEVALQNPYLAAEKYLQRQGADVSTYTSFDQISNLQQVDTLLIESSRNVLSKHRLNTLLEWVDGGGHIIAGIQQPFSEDDHSDSLLNHLGVEVYESELEDDNTTSQDEESLPDPLQEIQAAIEQQAGIKSDDWDPAQHQDHIASLTFNGIDGELLMHTRPSWALSHPYFDEEGHHSQYPTPIYWASNDYGVVFLQFELGNGLISLVNDDNVWQSEEIHRLDHAYLLSILTGSEGQVRILMGSQMPSIYQLAWRYGSEAVIALSIFILSWLLYRGRRFGKAMTIENMQRRSMAEHIDAAGHFHWQKRSMQHLLIPIQQHIAQLAQREIEGFALMDNAAQIQALAKATQKTNEEISQAMFNTQIKHHDEFTQTIQCLQQIKAAL